MEYILVNKKPVIGVMGAIASGKSFVSAIFGEFGFGVIDADAIVGQLYNDIEFVNLKLLPIFGEKLFDTAGKVNRNYISDVVFNSKEKLKMLNAAVHPAVISEMRGCLSEFQSRDEFVGIVLDVPLLLEAGLDKWCDFLVYIESTPELCAQRIAKRSKISKKNLEKRQKSQIFLDKKKNIANYILYNNSETSVIKKQVADVISDVFLRFGENNL